MTLLAVAGCGATGRTTPRSAAFGPNDSVFAVPETRIEGVDPEFRLDRMVLLLAPSAEQQQLLDALAAAQQDQGSSAFHQWLTPEEYGAAFGLPADEVARIAEWLREQGFQVEGISANRRMIIFSGTAGAVDAVFHAGMARYGVGGAGRIGNALEPVFPAEFAREIGGVVGLRSVRSASEHAPVAEFAAGAENYLAPADIATIYDVAPLLAQGVQGAGATIAVLARSNLLAGDVADFRDAFGLPGNPPVVVVNGADPGVPGAGSADQADFEETEMDTEWAGAVAPEAAVVVVASASTSTTDGIVLSAEYAVDHNVAPVIALSYGECEADLGTAENAMLNALWEQAAVQGITVVVASGDAGAAGCDDPEDATATKGRGVNGMCSTPYSLCVGGTEFTEQGGGYWATDSGVSGGSALGYVAETAWNESAAGGLWAAGGGASALYARPSWQSGTGNMRMAPDVALASGSHNAYLVWLNGAQVADSGTSAAAVVMAGMAALLVERAGERLGNVGPKLYALAAADPGAFHDIVSGDNSVPGVAGYAAVTGYDAATGLGSLDVAALAADWGAGWRVPKRQRCRPRVNCRPAPIRPRRLP
ncbi:MAG TPA: S53 family peptidase [Acidobacteriaceae bacterium]|jgi:subtilase family serine protease|nr:S53 family peptidase [Acidobacteriaceae bacterium]